MWRALPFAALLVPATASAQVISHVAGLFNIMAGLMLVISILVFFGGLGAWFMRLGTSQTHRGGAIKTMTWATVILFVLAALLAIVRFVQNNMQIASFILGLIVVALVGWFILAVALAKREEGDGHDH